MEIIRVLDLVDRCYNGDDGQIIHDALVARLKKHEQITISFAGVDSIPSSFVNTALISLLTEFRFDEIKRFVRFSETSSQINDMIKTRFLFETNRSANV